MNHLFMQIGRFFSLGQGRVGQLLSPRVLTVRSPFQAHSQTGEAQVFCCFGFEQLRQAQMFGRSLAQAHIRFQLRKSRFLADCAYEVVLRDSLELARTLAYWERRDQPQVLPNALSHPQIIPLQKSPAIAA